MNVEELDRVTKRMTLLTRKLEAVSMEIASNKTPVSKGKFPPAWFNAIESSLNGMAKEMDKIAEYWSDKLNEEIV